MTNLVRTELVISQTLLPLFHPILLSLGKISCRRREQATELNTGTNCFWCGAGTGNGMKLYQNHSARRREDSSLETQSLATGSPTIIAIEDDTISSQVPGCTA